MDLNRKRDLKQLSKRDFLPKPLIGELKVHVLDDEAVKGDTTLT